LLSENIRNPIAIVSYEENLSFPGAVFNEAFPMQFIDGTSPSCRRSGIATLRKIPAVSHNIGPRQMADPHNYTVRIPTRFGE
jgi:hypothetical protein